MEKMENLPKHIAIIPDGNRRWARKKTLAAWMGHKKGSESLEGLLEVLIDFKIPYFSFWGSSKDNLVKRPQEEVDYLLQIFKEEFDKLAKSERVHQEKIKIDIIGDWRNQMPPDVKMSMENAIEKTKDYDCYFFTFFIAYSGTDEMVETIKRIAALKSADPELVIDSALLKQELLTKDLPAVDLLVRTGGEPHNSDGFMMWDVADSQYVFSELLWPDFANENLIEAIEEYSSRDRRRGK